MVKFEPTKTRAFYDVNKPGEMMIEQFTNAGTVVHEMGHWYEDFDAYGRAKLRAFLIRRTTFKNGKRQNTRRLRDVVPGSKNDPTEITRADKFLNPYTGKVYESASRPAHLRGLDSENVYGTEIMSMAMEAMYNNAVQFAKEDPDFFDTIWDIMRAPRL